MGVRCVIAALLFSGWITGCLGDPPIEDLGSTGGGATTEPVPETRSGSQLDPGFEGYWVGYVENPFERDELGRAVPAVFPSGSTQVTLDYRFGESNRPVATLVFGAGPAQVPEPGVNYPAGVDHVAANAHRNFRSPITEGFEYQLTERERRTAGSPGNLSMLAFDVYAGFEEWCAVQPSGARESGMYDCMGGLDDIDTGTEPCTVTLATGETTYFDCNVAMLCLSDLCTCNADGCQSNKRGDAAAVLLEREGDRLVGTISGATIDSGYPGWYAPMGTLYLSRAD